MTKQLQVNCSISIAFYRQNRSAHPIRLTDKVPEVLEGEKELAGKAMDFAKRIKQIFYEKGRKN